MKKQRVLEIRPRAALRHLREVDARLAAVIDRVGPFRLKPRVEGTHFDAVGRAIVYQQLSGKAAATIYSRILGLYGGRPPTPAEILDTPDEDLRAVGLSRQKIGYYKDLAAKALSGEVPFESLHELDDAAIEAALCKVKGVGRWTAQMFLLFRLFRSDVLPCGDLGIQKGVQLAYGMRKLPTPDKVRKIGARWSPHASVASWYLWRVLDIETL